MESGVVLAELMVYTVYVWTVLYSVGCCGCLLGFVKENSGCLREKTTVGNTNLFYNRC